MIAMRLIAACAILLGVVGPASAQGKQPLPFALKELAPGVYAAIDGAQHQSGSNAGFIVGDNGVLVIDSFFSSAAASALVEEIHRITPKPIRYLVNTHYHVDHTGGDQVLRDAGAIIIAHRNVRDWIRSNNLNLLGDKLTPELKEQIETLPLPDVVTDKDIAVWLGTRKIIVRTVLGHTGGDLVVYVPDAKVMFTGDILWRKIPPNLIDGSVREWTATNQDLEHMADAAHIAFVPGHGDVASLTDVEDFRSYLADLRRLVDDGRSAGLKADALVKDVTPKLRALHPDWTVSDRAASFEIRYMEEELAGTKRRPVPAAQ